MKLWYRCEMCSPGQSRCFNVLPDDPPLSVASYLVEQEHARVSPSCPATCDSRSVVEILLVRMVQ